MWLPVKMSLTPLLYSMLVFTLGSEGVLNVCCLHMHVETLERLGLTKTLSE